MTWFAKFFFDPAIRITLQAGGATRTIALHSRARDHLVIVASRYFAWLVAHVLAETDIVF